MKFIKQIIFNNFHYLLNRKKVKKREKKTLTEKRADAGEDEFKVVLFFNNCIE